MELHPITNTTGRQTKKNLQNSHLATVAVSSYSFCLHAQLGIAQVPYDPTTTFNPVLQRLHRCLAVKSIDPSNFLACSPHLRRYIFYLPVFLFWHSSEAELPKVEETIKQMMQPSKHIMKAAANALVNFKRCFPTSVVEQNKKKKKRTFWGDRSLDFSFV